MAREDPFPDSDDLLAWDAVEDNGDFPVDEARQRQPYGFLTGGSGGNSEDVLTLKRVESDDLIIDLVRNAAGVEIIFTESGNVEMRETAESMMNLLGAKKLYFYLRGLLNPVTTLTHWEPEEIREHLKNTCHAFTKWLCLNWKVINLDKTMMEMVINNFRVVVHSKLNQALKGEMNKSLNRREERQIVRQSVEDGRRRRRMLPGRKREEDD